MRSWPRKKILLIQAISMEGMDIERVYPIGITTLGTINVVGRASPAPVEFDRSYQPTPDASTLRSTIPMLEIPQVVNAVSA